MVFDTSNGENFVMRRFIIFMFILYKKKYPEGSIAPIIHLSNTHLMFLNYKRAFTE